MASLAQQESQSLSQNVKLGLHFRYQDGKVQVNHNHFLGYTKDADGNLVIEEEEAKVVRRIFREYLEGCSFRDIAEGLERDGIKTGAKKSKWHLSTIQGILQNEKYIGDALLQKTITIDFIEKTRIKNDGSLPQYYVKDSHPAIIPKDIFTQVQEEMVRRANMFSGEEGKNAGSTQANMLFQVSAPAADVGTSTAGLPGTIEVSIPLSGDVAPGLNMGQALVMLQQYQSQNFRWRLSKQSTRCLSARTPCKTFLKKTSRRFLG